MLQLFLILITVSQSELSLSDMCGRPVPYASVCTDSTLIGISDLTGSLFLQDETDSVEIRALGFETWTGAVPASGIIHLRTVPVPSGMVVSVTAPRRGFREQFAATTTLTREDMEYMSRYGLRSLSSRCSGIYVREYGGAIPVISISIRGSDAAHSEYYIDGHRISSSMDGLPGLTLDPSIFGGLEISRGGGSGFIRGGMAGTLNFVPESGYLPPRASLIAGDDRTVSLSGGFSAGNNRISLSLRKLAGLSGSTAHDGAVLLHGRSHSFSYGVLTAASAGETESPDWTTPTDGIRKRYSFDGWGRWNSGGIRISAGIRTGKHLYSSSEPVTVNDTHDEFNGDLTAEFNLPVLPFHFGFSANTSLDAVRSTSIGQLNRLTGETAISAGYGSSISLTTSACLNFVDSGRMMNGMSLSAGLPALDSLLLMHFSGSTGFRRPTLNDLYWPEDNFARGNPDLRSETSLEFESGISLGGLDHFRFSGTGFYAETEDLIRWEPGAGGKWSPVNISRALRKGIEVEAWFSQDPFEITGTFTLLNVTDNCPESVNFGRTLPYTPDYTFALHAAVNTPEWIRWTISASGMGVRFKNYSETSWMPAYAIISTGIELSPEFMGNSALNVSVENLLDEEYHETSGYPGKPSTLYIGIEWNKN